MTRLPSLFWITADGQNARHNLYAGCSFGPSEPALSADLNA